MRPDSANISAHGRRVRWPAWARLAASFLLAGVLLASCLLLISAPWSWPAAAAGTRRYVAPAGACGLASPCYASLQAAVNAAAAGDEIRVAAGTYSDLNVVAGLTQTLYLNKSLTVRGGYVITDWETSQPAARPTVLDAQFLGRVVLITGTVAVTLDGLHLTRGVDVGSGNGAGVLVYTATVTVLNSLIYDNHAAGLGGGLYQQGGQLTLRGNRIFNNTTTAGGAGVSNNEGILLAAQNIISGNLALSPATGGAIDNYLGYAELENNLIYFNTAQYGGGVYNSQGSLVLRNDTLYSNTTLAVLGDGGIYNYDPGPAPTRLTATNLIVWGASKPGIRGDGSIYVTYSDVTTPSGAFPGEGNLDPPQDPQVVDAAAGDFRLTLASPVRDMATSVDAPEVDLEGRPRPWPAGGGYDMGAYEFYGADSPCYARPEGGQLFTEVQAALDAAGPESRVLVAGYCAGVTLRQGLSQTLFISQSLSVQGGFTLTDWVNPRYGPTVLDAQGLGRVVVITEAAEVTLEGLHLTGGEADSGAGIYQAQDTRAVLRNNVLYHNRATDFGGAIYQAGGVADLQHTTVYSNRANVGAGIYLTGSAQLALVNSLVVSNHATTRGGGIEAPPGQAWLDYNIFFGNTAASDPDYSGVTPGAHHRSRDPLFRDAPAADFHLTLASEAINTADPDSAVASDFEGDARPQGPGADMGADESRLYAALQLSQPPVVFTNSLLVAGKTVTFSHVLTNLGNTPDLTDSLVISASNSDGWPFQVIGLSPGTPLGLAAGQSLAFQVVVSTPESIDPPLNNRTVLTATSLSNPAAEASAQDVIVGPGVQLAPSYIQNADPGEIITYTHLMTNIGPSDSYSLTFSSPLAWGELITPTGVISLAYGQTQTLIFQVRVTDTAPANLADVMRISVRSQQYADIEATVTDTTIANPTSGPRYVSWLLGTDSLNNCTRKYRPCQTIAYAVNQAAWGDTVYVAEGSYAETSGILLNQLVHLVGGCAHDFSSHLCRASSPSVIDMQHAGRGLRVDLPAVFRPGIENFVIQNAQASGAGGGIYLQGVSSARITDVVVLNSSAQRGGGIYIESGSPSLARVVISGTHASELGGGLYLGSGQPILSNVVISGSTAISGGGLFIQTGAVSVSGLSLWNNRASQAGGGLYLATGWLAITQSRIASNAAAAGGGIYNAGADLTLWNDFIFNNAATDAEGGAIYHGNGQLSLVHNTLYGNQAARYGGGVFERSSSTLAVSSTILAANTASAGGGAIWRAGSGPLAVDYNLFWNNDSNVVTGSHSLSGDPRLADVDSGDLHLTPESPALDRGDPSARLRQDIDGDMRPINQGFDIGADELAGCKARNVTHPEFRPPNGEYGVIQEAVDEAARHDIIQISGSCVGVQARLVGDQLLSQTVFISKPLTLQGGYDSIWRYDAATQTELAARGLGRVVVISLTQLSDTVVISRLTLSGGWAEDVGGGLYNDNAELKLFSVVISDNQASYGAGVYNQAGVLRLGQDGTALTPTRIVSNAASLAGGGIYLADGQLVATAGELARNRALEGGGVFLAGGAASLTDLQLSDNAAQSGGGAYNLAAAVEAGALELRANSAISGAGWYNAGGQLTLARGLVFSNSAGLAGGGVYNAPDAALTLVNSLVVSNTAGSGAGVYNLAGGLSVRHATFFGNLADAAGGALYHAASSGAPLVNSSIFAQNAAAEGDAVYRAAGALAFDYNDVFDDDTYPDLIGSGTGNLGLDPAFVSTDIASGQFLRLQSGSPVEDEADPGSPVSDDIDGEPRPSNRGFDMGADELGGCYVRINGNPPTYGNIQLAANVASPGQKLYVAGTCRGVNPVLEGGVTLSQTLFLSKSLTIQGGYSTDNWSVPHPVTQITTLDAAGLGRVMVITHSAAVSISGLYLRGGYADQGGGLLVAGGALTMTGNWVVSNTASQGGALYVRDGLVSLYAGNQLYGNQAGEGAGIYNAGGQITLDNNLLRDNQASAGGAFYHAAGSSLVQNCVLRQNTATNGAAFYNAAGDGLVARHNTLYANSATNGGGFYNAAGSPTLVNSLLISNTASSGHAIFSTAAFSQSYNDAFPAAGAYAGVSPGVGSLFVDPQLVEIGDGYFRLADDSPVIDRGDPVTTLFHDFEGDLRPGDQGFDLGTDERPSCQATIVRTGVIYGNLQTAVDHSLPGDVIQVTAGECRGVHPLLISDQVVSQTVHITHELTIEGGYPGPDLGTPTILNPRGLGRAVLITGSAVVTLSNLWLQQGDATGLDGKGGGLYYQGSGGLLRYVILSTNTASYGGGLYDAGSGLTLWRSLVQSNTASLLGGGIYNESDNLYLREISLTLNVAPSGGGIYNQSGEMRLEANWVHHNYASDPTAGRGGGLYNADSSSLLDAGNQFFGNRAQQAGGAIYHAGGELKVWNSLIYDNVSQGDGGGGIWVQAGSPSLAHLTFYANRVDSLTGGGGALYIAGGSPGVTNTIFYSNTANSGAGAVHATGGSGRLNYNDYYGNAAPELVGISYGAQDVTYPPELVNPEAGDFHLLPASPLIDRGQVLAEPRHDFEGDPRPSNLASDIGADEYNQCLAKIVSSGEITGRVQAAIDAAQFGDQIWLAEGTCNEAITIHKPLVIIGGYYKDFSGQGPSLTRLDAYGLNTRVVTVTGVSTVTLANLWLTNGETAGNGGGLYSQADAIALLNMSVMGNLADYGGGLYIEAGKAAHLIAVSIEENQARYDGGGLYSAPNSLVTVDAGNVSRNQADGNGGGLYHAAGSAVTISGGEWIDHNTARLGAGIYSAGADLKLINKQINLNLAANGGGGLYIGPGSTLELINPGLYGNAALAGYGGALCRDDPAGRAGLYHATLHHNSAAEGGGGIYNAGSTMVVSASIIASNVATSGLGSGIYGAAPVEVAYSLQWDNGFSGTIASGPGNLEADPRFREPGGDLLNTSPAIDRVPDDASHVGYDRVNQLRPQICAKDMGRDEFKTTRSMSALAPPLGSGAWLAPGDSITYTFSVRNDSQNLTSETDYAWPAGTGYSETVTATLYSTRGWGRVITVENGGSPVISDTWARFEIGSGSVVTLYVQVSVPPGTWGSREDDPASYDASYVSYQPVWLCDDGAQPGNQVTGNAATTMVEQSYGFAIGPDNFGAAAPGQTLTYTHLITNLGNITDSYSLAPKTGAYASLSILEPADYLIPDLGPGMTATIVLSVSIRPEAGGGMLDVSSVIARSLSTNDQKAAADNTVISYTSGTRYVSALVGNDSLEGESYASRGNNCTQPLIARPCRTLQQAVDQASAGDLIKVAEGRHTELFTVTYQSRLVTQTVFVNKSLVIRGGYQTTDWSADPPNHLSHTTWLDAQGQGRALLAAPGITLALERVALVGGQAAGLGGGPTDQDAGGGLYNAGAELTLNATRIASSSAAMGGGLYQAEGNLWLLNSLLHTNQAISGAGLALAGGTATLLNNTFYANTVSLPTQGGGGVLVQAGSLAVTNTIFATHTGYALYRIGGTTALAYNLYQANSPGDLYGASSEGHDQSGDPLFADPLADPPNLAPALRSSPAVEHGDPGTQANTGLMSWDFANRLRRMGYWVDIGAYEYEFTPRLAFEPDVYTQTDTVGAELVITHILTNTGDFTDTIALTYTASLSHWPLSISPLPSVTLAADDTQTVWVTLTVPADGRGQTQHLVITATSGVTSTVYDTVSDTIFVLFTPGLEFRQDEWGSTRPLETITYTHWLTNSGDGQDTYTLAHSELPGWVVTIVPPQVTLPLSGSQPIAVGLTPPAPQQAISGTQVSLVITATSSYSPAVWAAVTDTTTISQVSGLSLAPDQSNSGWPGQALVYSYTLTQLGNYTQAVVFTYTTAPDDWAVSVPSGQLLAPGQTVSVSAWVTVPLGTPAGLSNVTTLTAQIESEATISASARATTTVGHVPGVLIEPPLALTALPGEVVTYVHTLTNTGNGPDSYTLSVSSPSFPAVVTPTSVGPLEAGASQLVTVSVQAPLVLSGTQGLAVVTATSVASPSLFDTVTDTTGVGHAPGVAFEPDRSGSGWLEQSVLYTHTLTNTGNATDTFVLSYSASLDWPLLITPTTPITLGMGQSAPVTVSVTISQGAPVHTAEIAASSVYYAVSDSLRLTTTLAVPLGPILLSPSDRAVTNTRWITFAWQPNMGTPPVSYTLYYTGQVATRYSLASTQTSVYSPTLLGADGRYTWTVEAFDQFGRTSGVTASWVFTVDTISPGVPVPLWPVTASVVPSDPVSFGWAAATDDLSGVLSYTLLISGPGGALHSAEVPAAITSTQVSLGSDGVYTWTVQALDAALNPSGYSPPITFTLDASGPERPYLIAPPDGTATNTQVITLAWSRTEQTVSYTLHLSDALYSVPDRGADQVSTSTLLAEGSYTWTVEAVDELGRSSGLTDTWVFTVDTSPPGMPLPLYPLTGSTVLTNRVPFGWQASTDNLSGIGRYTLVVTGGGAYTVTEVPGVLTSTLVLLGSDDVYTWSVQARDPAGNPSGFSPPITFTLDTSYPGRPTLLAPPDGSVTNTRRITFAWASSQVSPVPTYTLHLEGATVTTYTVVDHNATVYTDTLLGADGRYTWTVEAVDALGRSMGVTDTWVFSVDTLAPEAPTPVYPAAGSVVLDRQAPFTWTAATDEHSGVISYTLLVTGTDASTAVSVAAPLTGSVLSLGMDGVYTWAVRAWDAAGNPSPWGGPVAFTLNTTLPDRPTLIAPPDGTLTQSASITLTWARVSQAAGYTLHLSASLFSVSDPGTGSSVLTNTQLGDGVYTWTVEALDTFGRSSGLTDTWSLSVDTTPPITPLPVYPMTDTRVLTNRVPFTWLMPAPDLSGVVSYSLVVSGPGLYVASVTGGLSSTVLALGADGEYIWAVRAWDAAGNPSDFSWPITFSVDTALPAMPVLISPHNNALTNSTLIVLSWSRSPQAMTYTLHLSNDRISIPGPGPDPVISSTQLSDGVYTWTVEALDAWGRSSGLTDTWSFSVDATPPEVPAPLAPAAGTTELSNPVPFTWTAVSDNLSGVLSYILYVTGQASYSKTVGESVTATTLSLGADGVYAWSVEAVDRADNRSDLSLPLTFTLDATAPARPDLIAPPDGTLTRSAVITLAWAWRDQVVTYALHLSDSLVVIPDPGSGPVVSATLLADGRYPWTVEAFDQFGRSSGVTATWAFSVDTTAPTTPNLTAPSDGSLSASALVGFDWTPAQDNLSGVAGYTLAVSQMLYEVPSDVYVTSLSPDGVYTWSVRAVDYAGNTTGYTDVWSVMVDTTPPYLAPLLITPSQGVVLDYSSPVTFVWQPAEDDLSGVISYSLALTNSQGSRLWLTTTAESSASLASDLPDDAYTWRVWAFDRAGHSTPSLAESFVVDAQPPPLPVLIAPPDGTLTRSTSITLSWSRTDQTLSYTLHLSQQLFAVPQPAVGPVLSRTQLSDGVYTWSVEAIDSFGRSSGTTASWRFTLDRQGPSQPLPIYPYSGALQLARPVPFSWVQSVDATSGVAGYQVVVTGSTNYAASTAGQVTATQLALGADGVYTWSVWAVDALGNRSPASPPVHFSLDADPPPLPVLVSPPNGALTRSQVVTFRWLPSSDAYTYTLNINGWLYDVLAPQTAYVIPLSDGLYNWEVQAVDRHGRTLGYTLPPWQVTVDSTPPLAPILIAPADGTLTSTHPVTFQWAAVISDTSLGLELSVPLTYTISISGQPPQVTSGTRLTLDLANGFYTWTVRAHDRAGNQGAAARAFTFTLIAPRYLVELPLLLRTSGAPPPLPTPTSTPLPGPTPTPTPAPPRPDLVVDSVTLEPIQGAQFVVRVVVRNRSGVPVAYGNNFYVTVYVDPPQPPSYTTLPDLPPQLIWGVQGSWFGAGQSRTLEGRYTFASAGSHTLYAWADPYNTVVESDEDNNSRQLNQAVASAGEGLSEQASLPAGVWPTPTPLP